MGATRMIFLVVGGIATAALVFGLAWPFLGGGEIAWALVPMFLGLGVMGIVFLFVAGYLDGLNPAKLLSGGVPATAEVLSVQDTGVTINGMTMVLKARLRVTVEGAPPYEADTRIMLDGRNQWGAIQPGMTLPVKVDPKNPQKVVIDTQASAASMPAEAVAQAVHAAFTASGPAAVQQHGMVSLKAADIIRDGVATQGKLLQVTPTGLTAGQAAGGLEPDEADDPMVVVAFTFEGDGGREERHQAMVRVPDGKAGFLAAGATVPIAYLPGQATTATIDWSRLN